METLTWRTPQHTYGPQAILATRFRRDAPPEVCTGEALNLPHGPSVASYAYL